MLNHFLPLSLFSSSLLSFHQNPSEREIILEPAALSGGVILRNADEISETPLDSEGDGVCEFGLS